ncbi:L-dopachrome tautomerase-related protein [Sinomicrobium soli]|uniref:L-dopachrome tautomerase-related protein n=1 Tax=Sinomicrobium sp. N-1-3-6 TaxID=2219864 RepID=UPI000DCE7389|nr:L-dopachrome tautomerase-related protein [Sinomicrobium sp. N-1-3-6]RAV29088.1 gluconolactonase [Sinomicrobium sp. N-1-3-6]
MKNLLLSVIITGMLPSVSAQEKYHSEALEEVADIGKSMAIGLSVNSDNRVFVAFPNYDGDGRYALTEISSGMLRPYPDKGWNIKKDDDRHFLRIQDLYVDAEDRLWVLDSRPASRGSIFGDPDTQEEGRFKLVKINTATDRVEEVYLFEDLDKTVSGLNDVRVDTGKQLAYLSDPGQAAIVVLDLRSGKSRVVLKESPFTLADDIVITYGDRRMEDKNGKPFSSHVNGIALSPDFARLYFKPINKEQLFSIETSRLADSTLSERDLRSKVEEVGEAGITHGLIADSRGNIYLTTSTGYSISYFSPDGKKHTLVRDSRILWPDSLGIGTDGYLYFTCAQMQRLPQWNKGTDRTEYPYKVYRVKLPL